jgi:lipopolysaccharide/colanic/teichoic acid biosynthesis glycosyltransferase
MFVEAEKLGGAGWARQGDPRITGVGRILRPYRLDEIPQFVNVIRGEMNVVGPRPERPAVFERLSEEIPFFYKRKRVKPGITGLAQINQAYDRHLDDVRRKLDYDLEYIRHKGIVTDLQILWKTALVMFKREKGW